MQYFSASNEVVFVNFYADWCRFSQLLMPIFEEASGQFHVRILLLYFPVQQNDRLLQCYIVACF